MARLITLSFFPSNTQLLLPTTVAGGGATLSIPLANPYPFVFENLARLITFNSSDDLSGTNFTISGTDQFGNIISEILAGPNDGTVQSVNQYNTITNISSDDNYTNFSIGSGSEGTFQWIKLNTLSFYPSISVTIEVLSEAESPITYSLYGTLDDLGFYKTIGSTYTYIHPKAPILLGNDPLATTDGSLIITVTVPSTGEMNSGDIVQILGATDFNGLTADQINTRSMITVIDDTHFTYAANEEANASGSGGGNLVTYTIPALPNRIVLIDGEDTSSYNEYQPPLTALQVVVTDSRMGVGLKVDILQQGIH